MGIKDLNKILRAECPDQFVETHISHLRGSRVALDVSVFMYKYIRSVGEKYWLNSILALLCSLKKYRIKVVAIFDGKEAPEEKFQEHESRKKSQDLVRKRLVAIQDLNEQISLSHSDIDGGFSGKIGPEISEKIKKLTRLSEYDFSNPLECVNALEQAEEKVAKQCASITPNHAQKIKRLLDLMGMASLQAKGEAETLCAYLCINGKVDAVMTEDTDVLCYGCPLFLSKYNSQKETVVALRYKDILEDLDMKPSQFTDMCIMCGCDYNHRIRGIGALTAHKLLTEHECLENVELKKPDKDFSCLNYVRCRELFKIPKTIPWAIVPYNDPLDVDGLKKFLYENNCRFNMAYLESLYEPDEIEFESDEDF